MRRRGTTNLDDIRRALRLGMGPCQGGFCIYRATGILHGVDRLDGGGRRVAARLPAGALEGRVADPLRRPAAPGAAGRLDLPGPARRRAPARRRLRRRHEPPRRRRRRHRPRRADRRGAARGGGRARARAGQGRRRDAPQRRDDRRARLRARARRAPARGARPRCARRASVRAASAPTAIAAAVDWFKARVADGPLRALRLHRRRRGEPAAADRGRRAAAVGASCPRRWPRGDLRDGGAGLRRRLPRAEGLPPARCSPTTSPRGPGVEARAVELDLAPEGARRRQRARLRARVRRPRVPRRRSSAQLRARLAAGERVAFPAVLGVADPHGVWARARAAARAAGVRGPDAAAVGAGHARVRDAARGAAPRGRARACSTTSVVGAERDGRRASTRVRVARRAARGAPRRRLGRARHGRLRLRRARADSRWAARETALGLPVAGVPGRARSASAAGYFDDAADGARRASRSTASCGPSTRRRAACSRTCWWRARRSPAPSRGGRSPATGISLATGYRAAELILGAPTAPARRPRPRGADGWRSRRRRRARRRSDARVARPLRQVHDLRDVLPGLERHAAVPGAEVRRARRPSASASATSRRPTPRSTTARAAAICTQVCPQGVHIAEINTQARAKLKATHGRPAARPAPRPARRSRGRLGTPVGAARELDAAQPAAAARGRADGRAPPRRADAALRRAHVPALGAQAHVAAGGAPRRLLPRLRRPTTTSRGWAR